MHVMIISEYWAPQEHGGGERSAADLAEGLARQGVRVTVLTSSYAAAARDETVNGVRIMRILRTGSPDTLVGNIFRYVFFRQSAIRHATEFCRSNDVDVIHLMNTSSITLAAPLRACTHTLVTAHLNSPLPFCPKGDRIRHGKPCTIVCTWNEFVPCLRSSKGVGKMRNGWWIRDNPLVWSLLFRRFITYQRSSRAVHAWVAIGSGLVALLELHGVRDTIMLLPNPMDMDALSALTLPSPHAPLRVGFIGALTEFKGVRVLLEAVRGLPVELHVAGEGPLAAWIAAAGVPVHMYGRVANDAVPSFYAAVDIVVVPSLWPEAFGRVAVEAMAAGRPVIASDNGGLRDIIHGCKGSVLVPTGDAVALRRAIESYVRKPHLCSTHGALSRLHVQSRYKPKDIARAFARFFEHVSQVPH